MLKHRLEWLDGNLLIHLTDNRMKEPIDTIDLSFELSAMNNLQINHFAMIGLRHLLHSLSLTSEDKEERFTKMVQHIAKLQKTGKIYDFRNREL